MTTLTLIIGNKNYSSWSLRPWLAMRQAGIDFTEIRIPLDLPETRQQLLQHSPSGRVPALRHGDLLLWESLAICEYIAERFPDRQLYPADPAARAIARAVSAEMHAGFSDLRHNMPMDCRSRYPGQGMTPAVHQDIERITALWYTCRQQFGADGAFLFGSFGIADAMYAPVVSRFITYGVKLDPLAQAYADAIWALPAMQAWVSAATLETEIIPIQLP